MHIVDKLKFAVGIVFAADRPRRSCGARAARAASTRAGRSARFCWSPAIVFVAIGLGVDVKGLFR